jgi:hypothetical protein
MFAADKLFLTHVPECAIWNTAYPIKYLNRKLFGSPKKCQMWRILAHGMCFCDTNSMTIVAMWGRELWASVTNLASPVKEPLTDESANPVHQIPSTALVSVGNLNGMKWIWRENNQMQDQRHQEKRKSRIVEVHEGIWFGDSSQNSALDSRHSDPGHFHCISQSDRRWLLSMCCLWPAESLSPFLEICAVAHFPPGQTHETRRGWRPSQTVGVRKSNERLRMAQNEVVISTAR